MLDKRLMRVYSGAQIKQLVVKEDAAMTAKEAMRAIMAATGLRNADLASRMGASPQAAWDRVNGRDRQGREKDVTASLLAETLRAMDYKLVVMPRGSRTPADSYEIT